MVSEKQKQKNLEALEAVTKVQNAGGGMPAEMNEGCTLARREPENGLWYYIGVCPACKKVSPLFRDFGNGKRGTIFSGSGGVQIRCHHCPTDFRTRAWEFAVAQWSATAP